MTTNRKGALFPVVIAAFILAAAAGILANYIMPHRHHDLTGAGIGDGGAPAAVAIGASSNR